MTRIAALVGAAMTACCALAAVADMDAERSGVERWRAARVSELTGPQGWLNLVGLFWLEPGENTFGRATSNRIVLDHPALPEHAGSFFPNAGGAHFVALPGSGITQDGHAVTAVDLAADAHGNPTVLASGSLRFFIIERAGRVGVRIRDLDSPRLRQFVPIEYFPIDPAWALSARFEPYEPHHRLRIVNILGFEEDKDSPGALVFSKDGKEWRLDTILEAPGDRALFVMFADGTTGRETYGGGRYLSVPLPQSRSPGAARQHARVDFNEAYNPPCAFNDFATCPLPPYQNRLTLRIESGERTYEKAHGAVAR